MLGYYPKSRSNATDWGINNEALARKIYVKMMKKIHRNLSVIEGGFFIDLSNPFLGISPDGRDNELNHWRLNVHGLSNARDKKKMVRLLPIRLFSQMS